MPYPDQKAEKPRIIKVEKATKKRFIYFNYTCLKIILQNRMQPAFIGLFFCHFIHFDRNSFCVRDVYHITHFNTLEFLRVFHFDGFCISFGSFKVTEGTLGSIAVIVTVNMVCCATTPAGFSPGAAATPTSVVVKAAVPCFLTW